MSKKFDVILSRNFKLSEFCVTAQDYDNFKLSYRILRNIYKLAHVLQLCREYVNIPITITSGYRPKRLNKLVGGAENSFHLVGSAVDIVFPDSESYEKAWEFLCNYNPDNRLYIASIAELLGSRSRRFIHLAINCDERDYKLYIDKFYYE